jgi:UDP-glucose 4-epimerase
VEAPTANEELMRHPEPRGTALVTGAAGFMGAHLIRRLAQDFPGVRVVALDDLSGGFRSNLPADSEFVEGSVTDVPLVTKLFDEHRFDYVYHLAAYAAEGLSHFIRRFNYTNNVIGSVNLINEAIRHESKGFVFTSSIAVYGAGQVPMREDMVPVPEDPYGVAKYAVELDLRAAHEMFGLDYVVFRPHNVYGEYQNIGDRYRNVVGIFMNQILRGEPLSVFGDGRQQRAFSYVGDIVPTIASAPFVAAAANRVFNVGADRPCTVLELARTVSRMMGSPEHPIRHLAARNEVQVAYSDHSAAHHVFGEPEYTPLDEGLRKMAAWVTSVGARKSPSFGDIEVERDLPPFWLEQGE